MKNNHFSNEDLKQLIEHNIVKKNTLVTLLNDRTMREYRVIQVLEEDGIAKLIIKPFDERKLYKVSHKIIDTIDGQEAMYLQEIYELDIDPPITISEETNINEMMNKKGIIEGESPKINNIKLKEGMRIILTNDSDENMNDKILTVKIVDNGVKLVGNRGRPKKSN